MAIKVKLLPRWPAAVSAVAPIVATKAAGAVTLSYDSSLLPTTGSVSGTAKILTRDGAVYQEVLASAVSGPTIADQRLLGNVSGGTAAASALTGAQANGVLPAFTGDSGSGGVKGLVPAPAAGDAAAGRFLAASGTFSAPTFTQAGAGAVSRLVTAKLRDMVSVKDFGAEGDNTNDDTTAIQAAITAMLTSEGTVYFPAGIYKISSALSITKAVTLLGAGPANTIIRQSNGAANGIVFDFSSNQLPTGGGLFGLTIEAGNGYEAANFTNSGSTGTGILVKYGGDNFSLTNFSVNNFDAGILLNGCWNTRHYNGRVLFFRYIGVGLGVDGAIAVSAGNLLDGFKISNFGYTGTLTSADGIQIGKSGGEYWNNVDITSCATGVRANPATGNAVLYLFAKSVVCDTSIYNNWYLDGSLGGTIASCTFVDCWGAYSGDDKGVGGAAALGTGGTGLTIVGPNAKELEFIGFRARENAYQGVLITGTPVNVKFIGGQFTANSQLQGSSNTYAGIDVGSGTDIQIIGVRCGNFTSVRPNSQAEGIKITAGVTGQIVGCDVNNPGSGKSGISNGATGVVAIGNLPRATVGHNSAEAYSVPLNSGTTVAAASTVYLTPNGQMAFATQNPFIANKSGVVESFKYYTNNAPGVAQTYTYTLMKNGSATSMTATSSGNASFAASTTANPVTFVEGDQLEIRLVTSGTAAVSIHRGYISVAP